MNTLSFLCCHHVGLPNAEVASVKPALERDGAVFMRCVEGCFLCFCFVCVLLLRFHLYGRVRLEGIKGLIVEPIVEGIVFGLLLQLLALKPRRAG